MRITNRTRNTSLGTRVVQASTWWSRFRGLMGRREPKPGEGVLLVRCKAIHTWWMSFDLDVLFLNEKGKVLKLISSLPPWRFTKRVAEAHYVLELPAGTIALSGTEVGDLLTWRDPAPYTITVLSPEQDERSPNPHDRWSRAR